MLLFPIGSIAVLFMSADSKPIPLNFRDGKLVIKGSDATFAWVLFKTIERGIARCDAVEWTGNSPDEAWAWARKWKHLPKYKKAKLFLYPVINA